MGFGEAIGELTGPACHEEEGEDEDGAGEGEVLGAGFGVAGGIGDGGDGDDHLEDVVVEGAEELGPEEGLEAAVFEERGVAGVCHALCRGILVAKGLIVCK